MSPFTVHEKTRKGISESKSVFAKGGSMGRGKRGITGSRYKISFGMMEIF